MPGGMILPMGIFNASKSQMTDFKLKQKHFPQTKAFIQE
jgi:hypothetical protein